MKAIIILAASLALSSCTCTMNGEDLARAIIVYQSK